MLLEDLKLVLRRVEFNIEGPYDIECVRGIYAVKGPDNREVFTVLGYGLNGNILVTFYEGSDYFKGWLCGVGSGISAMKREIVKNFGGG